MDQMILLGKLELVEEQLKRLQIDEERRHGEVLKRLEEMWGVVGVMREIFVGKGERERILPENWGYELEDTKRGLLEQQGVDEAITDPKPPSMNNPPQNTFPHTPYTHNDFSYDDDQNENDDYPFSYPHSPSYSEQGNDYGDDDYPHSPSYSEQGNEYGDDDYPHSPSYSEYENEYGDYDYPPSPHYPKSESEANTRKIFTETAEHQQFDTSIVTETDSSFFSCRDGNGEEEWVSAIGEKQTGYGYMPESVGFLGGERGSGDVDRDYSEGNWKEGRTFNETKVAWKLDVRGENEKRNDQKDFLKNSGLQVIPSIEGRATELSWDGYNSDRDNSKSGRLDPQALMAASFPPNARFVYRVQTKEAATTIPFSTIKSCSTCAYHAAGFISHSHEPPLPDPRTQYRYSNEIVNAAYKHSQWRFEEPSPFISVTNDLLRAFTIGVNSGSESLRLSIIDLKLLPKPYWNLKDVLMDYRYRPYSCLFSDSDNDEPSTSRRPQSPRPIGLCATNSDFEEQKNKTPTEFLIWQCVPESAVIAHWAWTDITTSWVLSTLVSSSPTPTNPSPPISELLKHKRVSPLRVEISKRLDKFNLANSLEYRPSSIATWIQSLSAALNISISQDGPQLEFLLHFAVMLLAFQCGKGADPEVYSEKRLKHMWHVWPQDLDTSVFGRVVEAVEFVRREIKEMRDKNRKMLRGKKTQLPAQLVSAIKNDGDADNGDNLAAFFHNMKLGS